MNTTSPPNHPRVLAIIVNWNKRDYLQKLLLSLRSLGGTPFDLLVVDNASTDGSVEMVRGEFPECQLLETGENLGGTGGFNAGMVWGLDSEKKYDFLWLMDNDIDVHPGALDALLDAMQTDPKIAVAGSTILVLGQNDLVQEIGAHVEWRGCGLRRNGEGKRDKAPAGPLLDADYAAACSLLARVEAIRKVGIWDPGYFVFWDDVDWGIRFRRAGWRVVGVTGSIVEHEHFDNRRSRQSSVAAYLVHRNAIYFFRRFTPRSRRIRSLFHLLRVLLRNMRSFESAGRTGVARAIVEAVRDAAALRMGPAPQKIKSLGSETPRSRSGSRTPSPRTPHRVAFIATETSESALGQLRSVREKWPGADVHAVMPDAGPMLASEDRLGKRRSVRARSLFDRLKLSFDLRRYDVVVAPNTFPITLYLKSSKRLLLVDDDMALHQVRSGLAEGLLHLPRLVQDCAVAFWLALRMTMSPPPPVDYFPFRSASPK